MTHRKTEKFENFLAEGLREGVFTGFSYQVGKLGMERPLFHLQSRSDLVFDLASLTKALVTTPLAHWIIEDLDAPLAALPYSKGSYSELLLKENRSFFESKSAGHILSHTSGLRPWCNLWINCGKIVENPQARFARAFPSYQNGRIGHYQYSDIGFILLGYLLEDLSGESLDTLFYLFSQKVLNCLTGLGFSENHRTNALPTGFCTIRDRDVQGEVHDENCYALGGVSGHCGLFGSLKDVVCYLEALMSSPFGVYFKRSLEFQSASYMGRIGWDKGDGMAKAFAAGKSYGHLGFTGTSFWLDPISGHYHVFLTNRVVSSRRNPHFREYRIEAAEVAESLFQEEIYV